nr:hypothetical protein [Tanacetum cinerariifolium]GEV45526.1 hypothetical protein [Tanacetum cinerariifolium]
MVQKPVKNHAMRVNTQHYARITNPQPYRHVVPTTVLTKSRLVPFTAARPVTAAIPQTHVTRPRPAKNVVPKSHSPTRRNINRRPSLKPSNFPHKVTTAEMCDKKNNVLFIDTECIVLSFDFKLPDESHVLLRVPRENNMYNVDLKNVVPSRDLTCIFAKATLNESNLWHKRIGHINFKTMNKLVTGNLVRGLPSKVFENNHTCVACKKGKQHRASCKIKPVSSVSQPLQRLSWVFFLATKDETSPILKTFIPGIENQLSLKREFSVPRTPQQNGIDERKKRTLIKATRTICKTPSVRFMRPFGCPITILNTLDPLGKFDGKADERFLVGYSVSSKAFRVFNSRTQIVQENLHINFRANKPSVAGSYPTWLFDIDTLTKSMNYQPVTAGNQPNLIVGLQEHFAVEKAGVEIVQQYVLFPLWSSGSKIPQNTDDDATFEVKEPEVEVKKPESKVHVSPSSSDKTKNHDDKTKREAKEKSPVKFTLVPAVGKISTNSTNTFSATGPFNTNVSPTLGESSYMDPSQYPDDPDMPAHAQMILESIENGPLLWPTVEENGVTRLKKYSELSGTKAIQADCNVKATNIILQGLSLEVYALVSTHKVAKELWEIIQMLMQGTLLTKQEGEFHQQSKFSQHDIGLVVPVFQKGDDPIDAINHMMSFLTAVVTSWYPPTNNQLRTSSNPRQQATINNGSGNRGSLFVTTVRGKAICQSSAQSLRRKEMRHSLRIRSRDSKDSKHTVVGNKMHKAFPLPGESSHWQYKFPLPVEGVPTARRMEIPLPRVYTAMMKKLPVKENWQLH